MIQHRELGWGYSMCLELFNFAVTMFFLYIFGRYVLGYEQPAESPPKTLDDFVLGGIAAIAFFRTVTLEAMHRAQ